MTFGADAPNHPPQPLQAYDYHIGAEMKTHENDALDQTDYSPLSCVLLTHLLHSLTHD